MFTCKAESHPGLYEWIAFLDSNNDIQKVMQRHWNGKYGEVWQYRFANQVPLRHGSDALQVNWLELVITKEGIGEILYQNSFVTNHTITATSVIHLAQVGRTRWKIENENNNTLKTKGYHLEHNFGHGQQDLANVLASLNILAFLIHTIQEMIKPVYQRLRRALGARKTFFNDLRALPPETQIYTPKMVAGRWLLPGDGQMMVLNSKVAEEEGVSVGDYVSITSTERVSKWQVVGLIFDQTNGQHTAFVPLKVLGKINQAEGLGTDLMIQTRDQNPETQASVEKALADLFEKHDLRLSYKTSFTEMMAQTLGPFDILIYLLMSMAILAALVGGLGLMGALFINVNERTREIGVMRAVGGDSWTIAKTFIGEGILLGLISWVLSALLSTSVSRLFAGAIGTLMFGQPLNENLSWLGIGLWLVIILGISGLASLWPAQQAARVSVRVSLAYE